MIDISIIIIPLFATWFVISVFAQFNRFSWVKWIKYKDPFSLIPAWTFFAPNPGVTDFQLLYRDKLFNGNYTPWKEVELGNKSLLNAIWNPEKRRQKAIVDLCTFILQIAAKNAKNKVLLVSVPYLVILSYVTSKPRSSLSEYRQFLIARTFGYHTSKDPQILFISYPHRLSPIS